MRFVVAGRLLYLGSMRVTPLLALAMLSAACQPIVEQTPTPTPAPNPPVIVDKQVIPATVVIEVGDPSNWANDLSVWAQADTNCCPVQFSLNNVDFVGTALYEKWFLDLKFDPSAGDPSAGPLGRWGWGPNSNEEIQLSKITNSPGVWTDTSASQQPFTYDPLSSELGTPQLGPHTVQVFVSDGFANPPTNSAVAPYAPVDGGAVVSHSWVIDLGSCSAATQKSCTAPAP